MKYLAYLFYSLSLCCTLFTVSHLDHTLTDWKMEQYHHWYLDAKSAATALADGQSYCIIAQGTWQSTIYFDDFSQINIRPITYRHIQDQIYHYTLLFGSETLQKNHHIGIVINKQFYQWQFDKQQFVANTQIDMPCTLEHMGEG